MLRNLLGLEKNKESEQLRILDQKELGDLYMSASMV
jgi:hypothetical protein